MKFTSLYSKGIPKGSVLGINYSGMHDTSLALVAPDGEPLFCVSLERLSRVKQDGRLPINILNEFPWQNISHAAISVSEHAKIDDVAISKLHPELLARPLSHDFAHGKDFYKFKQLIPCETVFVPHHKSHAASAFWASGFDDAVCLVYDGGMANENCFGGLYKASLKEGISELDRFYSYYYANITQVYIAVTALLGFTPLKHEGKITGLAAYGKSSEACKAVLLKWYRNPSDMNLLYWKDIYSESSPPELVVDEKRAQQLRMEISGFSKEELAASVQELAESHILEILHKAQELGWSQPNICLAGGLFANVKINQKVAELSFKGFFVAPPMSDDGTALGAAWFSQFERTGLLKKINVRSMYLGPNNEASTSLQSLAKHNIEYRITNSPAEDIAALLANGAIVAIFQGASEFGPRALGNRSILASATDNKINISLNQRLKRTEFMPFAPVVRMDDADLCFENISAIRHACEYMTVTVNCTQLMKTRAPAVVHVDGTARPQLITHDTNPLIYEILTAYHNATGNLALVNTSFNVHEEPIVCCEEDALRGFFESGLDFLYIEGAGIIDRSKNLTAEIAYLRNKIFDLHATNKSLLAKARQTSSLNQSSNILFANSSAFSCYLVEGFHAPEDWGVWSSGRYAKMIVPIDLPQRASFEAHITLIVKIFDSLKKLAPVLQITINRNMTEFVLFRPSMPNEQSVSLYYRLDSPLCEIEFFLTHSDTPYFTEQSSDMRELGFGLNSFGLTLSPINNNELQTNKDNAIISNENIYINE